MPTPLPQPLSVGMLTWVADAPDRDELRRDGFARLEWAALREQFIAPARAAGAVRRTSLASPAQPLLDRFQSHSAVAVVDVCLDDLDALRCLHDYVLRPAWHAGCRLLIHADRMLAQVDPASVVEKGYEHPFTLERTLYLAAVMSAARGPAPQHEALAPSRALDPEQTRAVASGDGVVQIIAPAGSGKTTVLVQRVRELIARGTPPQQILCATFNKAAADEMGVRLSAAAITGVQARTFHAIGLMILRAETLLRGDTRGLSLAQWRRLSALANKETGTWIEPSDAREAIGEIKLAHLKTAVEWDATIRDQPLDDETKATAAIYTLYEQQMRQDGNHDFDDQIMLAVRALRSDRALRARWQQKFSRVLVDEYQDIEPAQEMLVQILAAPEDSLFAVGDEDQTLYGWRRASVERIVRLDQRYPSLQRVALATNYRCPPSVVSASATLIEHNTLRFPKTINAAPGRSVDPQAISLEEAETSDLAAIRAAGMLSASERGEIVVLARTVRKLREVALACVGPQVRIAAPDAVFAARGAQACVEAHLRLAADPLSADPDDVATVLRNPSRGTALDSQRIIAERLRAGADWPAALAGQGQNKSKLDEAGALLDLLATVIDAAKFIGSLRGVFGLDKHFGEYEKTFGGAEQTETEALADLEKQAAGLTVAQYAAQTQQRRDALLALRDQDHGVELCTIHGSKGREWPTVIVYAFDERQMPHAMALEVTPEQAAAGEGEEGERRVAYVALTRAKERLHLLHVSGTRSRFAWQSGLAEPPPPPPRPKPPPPRQPPERHLAIRGHSSPRREPPAPVRRSQPWPGPWDAASAGPSRPSARESRRQPVSGNRVPPADAARELIRESPDRASGLLAAGLAISDPAQPLDNCRVIDVLVEAPVMSLVRAREILDGSGVNPEARVGGLDAGQRETVTRAIEAWAAVNG